MRKQISQEHITMLAEVQVSLLKIKRRVRIMNNKMEKCNHKNNNQKIYVVENHVKKKKDNK